MSEPIETRVIKLPKGGDLEVDVHPGLYDAVRVHCRLKDDEPVDDDSLRMFIFRALDSALTGAERKMLVDDEEGHEQNT